MMRRIHRWVALAAVIVSAGCASRAVRPPAVPLPQPSVPAKQKKARHQPARIPIVRIGIAPEVEGVTIGSEGAWKAGVIGGRAAIEDVPPGGKWTIAGNGDRLEVRDDRGNTRKGGTDTLFAFPLPDGGAPLQVDGKAYRGELLVFPAGGGRVTVVDVLDLESYLRGVLPAEIGGGGEDRIEAVKAQAVAARSYTLAYVDRWRKRGFDLLATVEDQVYGGMAGERADTDEALRETRGVIAVHDGRPIEAYYSSTCGGFTSTPEEAWGRPGRAYLKAHRDAPRKDAEAFCSSSPHHRWTERWNGPALEKILRENLPAAVGAKDPQKWGRLKDLRIKKQSRSLRVEELEVVFERKSFTLRASQVRMVLRRPTGEPLRSTLLLKIRIARRQGRVDEVAIDGAGYGHGVGLCQMGAIGMARAGYDYRRILHFYYRGARLVRAYDRWPA